MAYRNVLLGDYFKFEKGLGYKGEFLVDESEVAMIGMDSHEEGGGYKKNSEKLYSGPYKQVHIAETGDVIFAATEQGFGLLASPLMVPESDEYETFIYSHHLLKAFVKQDGFLPEYLYNIFRVKKYRDRAAYGDIGSTVRALPAIVMEEQVVPLPDLKEQKSINEVISLIDQQIENNKALAINLELLSQSIFKSWFIDFEPVHAKARGEKLLGLDEESAILFPDSFENSEFGPIPKGWQLLELASVADLVMGQSPPGSTYNFVGEGLPFFQGRSDFGTRFPGKRVFCTHPGRIANKGDVLVSVRAPVGDINQADSKCIIGRGVAAVRHKSDSEAYSYCLVQSMKSKFSSFNGEGTVFGAINRKDFAGLQVVEPSANLIEAFDRELAHANDLLLCKHLENMELLELREILLENLIDGTLSSDLLGEFL